MKSAIFGLALAWVGLLNTGAPLQAQAAKPAATLTVIGAEPIEPLMLLWEESYQKTVDPTFKLNFSPTMSSSAIQSFIDGKTLIAPVTRDMKTEELNVFTQKWGFAPTRVAVAMDALVILVNKNNPIKEAKIEQLDALWTTSRMQGWPRDVRSWGDLGLTASGWADRPVRLIGHPEGSGTREFFKRVIEADGSAKPGVERGSDVMSMIDTIISDQTAMGYASISQVFTSTKSLAIVPVGGKAAVEPSQANVANGSYPLSMFTYIYVNKAPGKPLDGPVLNFLSFMLSKEGQRLVQMDGRVPLPEDLLRMNLRRLGK